MTVPEPVDAAVRARVESLLRDRVPLTLLLDLFDPEPPSAQELLEEESGWLTPHVPGSLPQPRDC
ncbi:hypothetical protein [Cellulomonas massiliensis]|uniref:hypothetical protein n=1 Tax=Cellulomonas massiliensis TaxID=1465811 RepID=UPI0011C8771A|nr:hypothetical protein [Cellulomonas massiliensis]